MKKKKIPTGYKKCITEECKTIMSDYSGTPSLCPECQKLAEQTKGDV